MTSNTVEAPAPVVPFEWLDGSSDHTICATPVRNGIPIGAVVGQSAAHHPPGYYRWNVQVFLPGAAVPEPFEAPGSALPTVKHIFKKAFDDWCNRFEMRPVAPLLRVTWRDLPEDRGYGLYSGERPCARIYQKDGRWWQDSFLFFGDEKGFMEHRPPASYCLDAFHCETLEDAKNQAELMVIGWLAKSHFMMRWDPDSLIIAHKG